MIKKFALMMSVVLLAATANLAEAATQKMPRDERCQHVQRSSNLFDWLKNNKEKRQYRSNCDSRNGEGKTAKAGKPGQSGKPGQPAGTDAPGESAGSAPAQSSTTTASGSGKGNNGKGTPNGGKTDGGDPPGGGNTGNDGEG